MTVVAEAAAPATADPIGRLPERAAQKISRIERIRTDMHALYRARQKPLDDANDDLRRAKTELAEVERSYNQGRLRKVTTTVHKYPDLADLEANPQRRTTYENPRIEPDEDRLAATRAKVAAAQRKRDEIVRDQADIGERSQVWGALIQAVERYLESLPRNVKITEHSETTKAPKTATLESVRGQLAALATELDQTRRAPLPSSEVKELIGSRIETLAELGKPDLFMAVETGEAISWPMRNENFLGVTTDARQVTARGNILDALALTAWLHRDVLIDALGKEIDAIADDGAALSREERREREQKLQSEILDAGRIEETLIEAMEVNGADIPRRADADPRALLGLSSDLPAPKK